MRRTLTAAAFLTGLAAVLTGLPPRTRADTACPLDDQRAPLVRLTPKDTFEAARVLSEQNRAALARIDGLLRSGALGPPASARARRRAHMMARLSLANVYAYLFRYAEDPHRVYEADERALAPVFSQFCEPAIFPLARLRRVRMGLSHVCARYDLGEAGRGQTVLGGHLLRYSVRDEDVKGARRRVLGVEWASPSVGSSEILLDAHYNFGVSHLRSEGPPGPYELYVAHELSGAWVRRFGIHRPTAFMYWASPLDPVSGLPPKVPLVGIRVYVPSLKFALPSILPDIDLDDLRSLDLPLPLIEVTYLRQGARPPWLALEGDLNLLDWHGVGPLPPAVRQRFPNR